MNPLKSTMNFAWIFIMFLAGSIASQGASAYSATTNQLLAQTRAATAKYHDVAVAEAAGYVADEHCVPGMGYHYIRPDLLAPGVTETEPEVLLYVDTPNGGKKLVGVEYLEFATPIYVGPNPPDFTSINPTLFDGQVFNGPMEGHGPGMPWHYDLHVWIWSNNPQGTFATLNPNITCE